MTFFGTKSTILRRSEVFSSLADAAFVDLKTNPESVCILCFQIATSLTSVVVNLFCAVILLSTKELRNMDFAFVAIQTVSDLITTGILGSVLYSMKLMDSLQKICKQVPDYDECSSYAKLVKHSGGGHKIGLPFR